MYDGQYEIRTPYELLSQYLQSLQIGQLIEKNKLTNELLLKNHIEFNLHDAYDFPKKIYPIDIIPRIISREEWEFIRIGITQRLKALNLFLLDIYSSQSIIKDNIIPAELIYTSPYFIKELVGYLPAKSIFIHISGFDLVRDVDGVYRILEDNLRIPSGVFSSLESRWISDILYPELLQLYNINGNCEYPKILKENLQSLIDKTKSTTTIVVLTLGAKNSYSYLEQLFLARSMDVPLVEYKDLVVIDNKIFLKSNGNFQKVDIIYRRMDDEYFTPSIRKELKTELFDKIYQVYLAGNVIIANALGNGIADDKALYFYVPKMIKYYLNEEPVLKQVDTFFMFEPEVRESIFKNINKYVIKKVDSMRGIGMLFGNSCTDLELLNIKAEVFKNSRNYIAQPIVNFSELPCFINGKLSARKIDLRPYAIFGSEGINVVDFALTRVAITENTLDVSSGNGYRKDTFILT